jgi:ketosteroid isomerase-like protein
MAPDGPPLEGREAILASMGESYDIAMVQQSATTDEVVVIGDYAYAHGTWNLDPTAAAAADMVAMYGKWSTVFKRGPDGTWRTWRWMWNQPSNAVPVGG